MSADQLLLGAGLGAVLGLTFAALGAGGGLLAVPVLLYVFHQPLTPATGTALAILFGAAVVSAVSHHRHGNVDWKVAAVFGAGSLTGAPLGALLHQRLPERLTLGLFCAVLLAAAVRMGLSKGDAEAKGGFQPLPGAALGVGIGVLSGLLGVGGGFLIVPALTTFLGVPVRRAIGTSTAVVGASSLGGAATYVAEGAVEPTLLAVIGGGAALGALLGAPLGRRLPEPALRKAFAVLALGVCGRMLASVL